MVLEQMNQVQKTIQLAVKEREYELPELVDQIQKETDLTNAEVAKEIWWLLDSRQIRVTSDRKLAAPLPSAAVAS